MRVCVSYVVFLLLRIGVRHRGSRHVCCDRSGDDGDVIVSAVNVRPCGVLSLGVADTWGGAETVDRAELAGMLSDFAPGRSGRGLRSDNMPASSALVRCSDLRLHLRVGCMFCASVVSHACCGDSEMRQVVCGNLRVAGFPQTPLGGG
ncbi:hypothetical protein BBJK_01332 [Bifidobacterium bifidum LMG 13195]|uniref:Uncharacterized protein n=1 Tax=Bifidobacterium bifidum LMG 13195 TaxID=1207542 RepID=A0A286TDD5_BIFBI|nr:hypothetical protein BBJK_01332 [Bifidobacterium bifidum LMG 13195]